MMSSSVMIIRIIDSNNEVRKSAFALFDKVLKEISKRQMKSCKSKTNMLKEFMDTSSMTDSMGYIDEMSDFF